MESSLKKENFKINKLSSHRPLNSVQWNEKLTIATPKAPKAYIRNYKSSLWLKRRRRKGERGKRNKNGHCIFKLVGVS